MKRQELTDEDVKSIRITCRRYYFKMNLIRRLPDHTLDDVLQEVYLSCIKAMERYDESKGKVLTFLSLRIRGSIWDIIRKHRGKNGEKPYEIPFDHTGQENDEGFKIGWEDFDDMEPIIPKRNDQLDKEDMDYLLKILTSQQKMLADLLGKGYTKRESAKEMGLTGGRITQISKEIAETLQKSGRVA